MPFNAWNQLSDGQKGETTTTWWRDKYINDGTNNITPRKPLGAFSGPSNTYDGLPPLNKGEKPKLG